MRMTASSQWPLEEIKISTIVITEGASQTFQLLKTKTRMLYQKARKRKALVLTTTLRKTESATSRFQAPLKKDSITFSSSPVPSAQQLSTDRAVLLTPKRKEINKKKIRSKQTSLLTNNRRPIMLYDRLITLNRFKVIRKDNIKGFT